MITIGPICMPLILLMRSARAKAADKTHAQE
jgi:hypothetical protein